MLLVVPLSINDTPNLGRAVNPKPVSMHIAHGKSRTGKLCKVR